MQHGSPLGPFVSQINMTFVATIEALMSNYYQKSNYYQIQNYYQKSNYYYHQKLNYYSIQNHYQRSSYYSIFNYYQKSNYYQISNYRIRIVGRSRNSVRSPINIRFRNTNRYRDKWCTASHIRVKKTNFGAETNSPTCSFISCFWIGGGNYLFLADFQAVSQQSIIVYSFASLKFVNSALTSNPRGLNHHLKTILRSFSKLKSNSRLTKLFDF